MKDFDPGHGWREVGYEESVNGRAHIDEYGDDGRVQRRWVREEPVPPLPTEPYTVIRVTWHGPEDDANELILRSDRWWTVGGPDSYDSYSPGDLAICISGFEVLTEPTPDMKSGKYQWEQRVRRETAKAVLDRVRAARHDFWTLTDADCDQIAEHFGVES